MTQVILILHYIIIEAVSYNMQKEQDKIKKPTVAK